MIQQSVQQAILFATFDAETLAVACVAIVGFVALYLAMRAVERWLTRRVQR